MAVSIPRPSFPPPTSALPVLPTSKVRENLPAFSDSLRSPNTPQFPSKLALRTPSRSVKTLLPSATNHTNSNPKVPTLRSLTNPDLEANPSEREIRKVVSIASFPQPPKVAGRRLATESKHLPAMDNQRAPEGATSPRISAGILKVKKPKIPAGSPVQYTPSGAPSLLNGSGDGKAISGAAGARGSDGLSSLLSPSQSRSSSAEGSYSTSATTFEDIDENARRAREEAEDFTREKRRQSGSKETKGNVLVSVRVRPDAAGSSQKSDGEWMVDGRRSLVSYKGRERGDYYYGSISTLCIVLTAN